MTAPPILSYDSLPRGSGITVQHENGRLLINAPREQFTSLVQRSIKSPRFWIFAVVVWLILSSFVLIDLFVGEVSWAFGIPFEATVFLIAMFLSMLFQARRRELVEIDSQRLVRRQGRMLRRSGDYDIALIQNVLSNGRAIIVKLNRPRGYKGFEARQTMFLIRRDPTELALVAREIRDFLGLDLEVLA